MWAFFWEFFFYLRCYLYSSRAWLVRVLFHLVSVVHWLETWLDFFISWILYLLVFPAFQDIVSSCSCSTAYAITLWSRGDLGRRERCGLCGCGKADDNKGSKALLVSVSQGIPSWNRLRGGGMQVQKAVNEEWGRNFGSSVLGIDTWKMTCHSSLFSIVIRSMNFYVTNK